MSNCDRCFYNFDGICANHCYFETFINDYVDQEFDPYGHFISELSSYYESSCSGFRKFPDLLIPQDLFS